jgi:hypothetical protein
MTERDEVRRIAEAHADFYANHEGKDFEEFVREHWHPDIEIYFAGMGREPADLGAFLRIHSAESGFSWDDTAMEVERVVVDDDTFVLKFAIVRWRSHEADASAVSGDGSDSLGYMRGYIPGINIYTVKDGKVARTDSMIMASLAAAGTPES